MTPSEQTLRLLRFFIFLIPPPYSSSTASPDPDVTLPHRFPDFADSLFIDLLVVCFSRVFSYLL